MKKKHLLIGLTIILLTIPFMLGYLSIPVRADTYNSDSFDNSKEYVYNVTQWDSELNWYFSSNEGWVNTNPGGIIRVAYTGLYNFEGPFWVSNAFEDPVPHINISFYERKGSTLFLNRTMTNISSAEAAYVSALGYREFLASFLIPTDNFSRLEERFLAQNVSDGPYSDYRGDHEFKNLTDTIKIIFRQNTGGQNTSLLYNKTTGVLIWAKVQSAYGPDFEIELIPSIPSEVDIYSSKFDINNEYIYNVTSFDQIQTEFNWYFGFSNKGKVKTNIGGKIQVLFTGFYDYIPGIYEPNNVFRNAIPYIDIGFYEKSDSTLIHNRTLTNISSVEAAYVTSLGYREFNPGFLIPTDNFTRLEERVLAKDVNDTYVNYEGDHSCEVKTSTVNITFIQDNPDSKSQNITLIYDKSSGVLLSAEVKNILGPDFEIELLSSVTDTFAPIIEISSPNSSANFTSVAPTFDVDIYDFPLPASGQIDTMWYSLNGGNNFTFTANGKINQTAWETLPDGDIEIIFYANDTAGNLASKSITITKNVLPEIPSYPIMVFVPIAIATLVGLVLIYRKKTTKNY